MSRNFENIGTHSKIINKSVYGLQTSMCWILSVAQRQNSKLLTIVVLILIPVDYLPIRSKSENMFTWQRQANWLHY